MYHVTETVIHCTLVQDNTQRSGASKSFNQHHCNSSFNNYGHGSCGGRRAGSHYLNGTVILQRKAICTAPQ